MADTANRYLFARKTSAGTLNEVAELVRLKSLVERQPTTLE
jgi:hypothetical protein